MLVRLVRKHEHAIAVAVGGGTAHVCIHDSDSELEEEYEVEGDSQGGSGGTGHGFLDTSEICDESDRVDNFFNDEKDFGCITPLAPSHDEDEIELTNTTCFTCLSDVCERTQVLRFDFFVNPDWFNGSDSSMINSFIMFG